MRKLILYIATSLGGYIARIDGRVDWLEPIPNPGQPDMATLTSWHQSIRPSWGIQPAKRFRVSGVAFRMLTN